MNIVTDTIPHLIQDDSASPASGVAKLYPRPKRANRLIKNRFFLIVEYNEFVLEIN